MGFTAKVPVWGWIILCSIIVIILLLGGLGAFTSIEGVYALEADSKKSPLALSTLLQIKENDGKMQVRIINLSPPATTTAAAISSMGSGIAIPWENLTTSATSREWKVTKDGKDAVVITKAPFSTSLNVKLGTAESAKWVQID